MGENDIEQWVKSARAAGVSDAQITQQLKASGWTDEHISQIFGVPKAPSGLAPIIPVQPKSGHNWFAKHLAVVIGVGAGVLLLGGAAFAAWRGYIPVPFIAKSNLQEQLEKAVEILSGTKSGELGLMISVKVEPHDGVSKEIPEPKEGVLSPAKARAYDSELASNAGQLRTALALYFDTNTSYPDNLDALVGEQKFISRLPEPVQGHDITYTVTKEHDQYTLEYQCLSDKTKNGKVESKEGTATRCTTDEDTTSVFDAFDSTALFQFLPSDMQLDGSVVSFVGEQDINGKKSPRGYVKLKGTYASGGTTIGVDGEVRMQDAKYYGIVRQFPSLFFIDLTSIKDKWVVIDPAAGDSASDFFPLDSVADSTPESGDLAKAEKETAAFIKKSLEAKAIVLTREGSESLNGRRLSKIKITVDAAQLPAAVTAYKADATSRNALVKEVGTMLDELVLPENLERLSVITGQTSLTIWLENFNSTPHKLELTSIIVPPGKVEKLKGKQVRATIALTLEHIGEQPSVDVPANPISLDEATRLISGISEEQQKFDKQRSAIEDLRSGLQNYSTKKGVYPDNLAALLEKPEAATGTTVNASLVIESVGPGLGENPKNYFGSYSSRSVIPNDTFTGKAFPYEKTAAGYTLAYEMKLPKSTDDDGLYGGSSYYTGMYVEGKNTANEKTLSVEKRAENDKKLGLAAGEREKLDNFTQQSRSIRDIRSGLSLYYQANNRYPETLTALNENRPSTGYSYLSGQVLGKDAYTGKDFAYTAAGATYTLTYTIELPKKTYTNFSGDLPYISSSDLSQFVDGKNTATETNISNEAVGKTSTPITYSPTSTYTAPTITPIQATVGKDIVSTQYAEPLAGSAGTMHFWVRSENWKASSYMHMVNYYDSKGKERLLVRYANDGNAWLSYILYPEGSSFVGWTAKYSDWKANTWTHVAITWKVGEVPKLYVNGKFLDTYITKTQEEQVITQAMANALNSAGTLYLNGRKISDGSNTEVDTFTVENNVLSAQEILTLSANGHSAATQDTPTDMGIEY